MKLNKYVLNYKWRLSIVINEEILKEINPQYALEGLMLKLKLQYFGHLMWRADSLEKILMLGKIEGKRRTGRQRMRRLDSIIDPMDTNLSKLWEIVWDRKAWHAAVPGVAKSQTRLSNWTTTKINVGLSCGPWILFFFSLSANFYLLFHTAQSPLPQGSHPWLFSLWQTSNYVLWWHHILITYSMWLHWTFPV